MKVETVFGLSDGDKGGNRAGICLNEEPISNVVMQKIANCIGYAETAFLQILNSETIYIDFFTPEEKVPICGHATIAAFHWLKEIGVLTNGNYKLKTEDFSLNVIVSTNQIMMEQPKAIIGNYVPFHEIAKTLGISLSSCHPSLTPQIVSTGIDDILIGVDTIETLKSINPDHNGISELCKKFGAQGFHVFAPTEKSHIYYVRNFAPLLGIPEESATGTSNCALSAYLHLQGHHEACFIFKQGMWMDEPSEIVTRFDLERESYWVGGLGRVDRTILAQSFDNKTGEKIMEF